MRFEGIYTPVITPFREDFSIDFDAYMASIDYLIEAGVHGVVVGGTTGEYYVESHDERVRLLEIAVARCAGRVPVIFGTGSIDPNESIRLARAAAEYKADAILVATPPYSLPTEHEVAQHVLAVDRAANLPVMLYNYPARMGTVMGEACLDEVLASPNIRSIKESSGDINRLHLLMQKYPDLQTSCGMDDQALEYFAWGARSWVCAGSNFLAEEHIALYDACVVEGDFDKGRRIMGAMMPLMSVLEQGGKFIQSVKHGVTLAGRFAGVTRKPLLGLDEAEQQQLETVIRTLKASIAAIQKEGK
ncbi:dihydrodipicolinate synthase family protein [Ectopseudomonas khazarica]|jgi:4-hydroxy-tetrahydrodipicolinate synthase|uniref:dihydrodipicolinate synthase family protein n=1 Tax=Ectopseudomonas khazarica TaxID=2502979 RepID=UPI0006482EFA|nr:dihydrodipicolinate synthase family protein [Pseudomonas khazarica]QTS84729.1 dihydrodipicolinate synthase family protein [Pseudomonas khazarica]HIQ45973.1 dihydrodipicolinate synthase family protein [Pseudomonas oleovorans]